jgi:flavin reductase
MLEIARYRNGMAMLAGAVNVITTDGPRGKAGFTATAVCTVTDQPPTLLVCMNRSSYAHPFFVDNGVLCVNLLAAAQQELSGVFANREIPMDERFARTDWATLETGSPAFAEALVSFDCRIAQVQEIGSHTIFFCEVLEMQQSDAKPGLVYFNRGYHHLAADKAA